MFQLKKKAFCLLQSFILRQKVTTRLLFSPQSLTGSFMSPALSAHTIVMSENGVTLLVHSENNSKRKSDSTCACSIPLMALMP